MDNEKIISQKGKVLFLEDEEVLGRLYEKGLHKAGYEVKWLKTVQETELAASEFPADVIVLDHAIRGEERTGMDILPYLKKVLPESKIIILSNYNQSQLKEKNKEDTLVNYLLKIDTPPALLGKYVEKLIG